MDLGMGMAGPSQKLCERFEELGRLLNLGTDERRSLRIDHASDGTEESLGPVLNRGETPFDRIWQYYI